MGVALDGRMLYRDRAGIGRYIWELQHALAQLPAASGARVTLLVDRRDRRNAASALPIRRLLTPARHRLEAQSLPFELRPFRLAHFPDHGIPPGVKLASVVTVHDLSFLTLPDTHDPRSRAHYIAAVRTLWRAARVIAVSGHVRQAILEHGLAPADRVTVIPEAPSTWLAAAGEAERDPPTQRPYALLVGTIQPRKNIERAARAFVRTRASGDLDLLVAGALGYRGPEIVRSVGELDGNRRVRFVGRVGDARLAGLLRHASFLLLPSLDEGFGLPVLEAMALGVPCLVADAGALPEVSEAAALRFDPRQVEDIASAIDRLVADDGLRQRLVEQGRKRVGEFSWARTAQATADVYNSLL